MAAVVLVALLVVPGGVVGRAAGLRGWTLAAGAPLLTLGLVGVSAPFVTGTVLRWNLATLLGVTAVATLVVVGLRLLLPRPHVPDRAALRTAWRALGRSSLRRLPQGRPSGPAAGWSPDLAVVVAVLAAGLTGALAVYRASDRLRAFPQWWDTTFHANAIRFVADTGDADPAALRTINFPGLGSFYYPDAYHCLGALVRQITGLPVQAVLNLTDALAPGLLALSLAALVIAAGAGRLVAATTALLSCAFGAVLDDTMVWGPLFPFVLGLAVLPAAGVLVLAVLREDGDRPLVPVTLGLAGVGLIALHPGIAVAAVVLAAAALVQALLARRVGWRAWRGLVVAGVVLVVLGLPQIRGFLGGAGSATIDWPADTTPAAAVGHLLLGDWSGLPPQWWLLALVLLGLVSVAAWRPLASVVVAALGFAVLTVMAASYEGPWVAALTRPWWNDRWRLAALATAGLVVLAGAGTATAVRALADRSSVLLRWTGRVSPERHRVLLGGAALVVVAVVVALTGGLYLDRNTARVSELYGDGPTVTADKLAAYGRLADLDRDGSPVMNDPQDGSAWMWAAAGVRPVFGHALIVPTENASLGADRLLLLERFNRLDDDPVVRAVVARTGIRYVMVGDGFVQKDLHRAPGLVDLDRVRSLRLVFADPGARVYALDPQAVRP